MQVEKNFWDFFKKSVADADRKNEADAEARGSQLPARLVPPEASLRGGDPILLLLPQQKALSAANRYYLVYEGTNRRHLATCEVVPGSKALFSRVPEHDRAELVNLSVFADSQQLETLSFTFTADQLLAVAADVVRDFPRTPESLVSLRRDDQDCDTDRRLCDALRRSPTPEQPQPQPQPGDDDDNNNNNNNNNNNTVFHFLAEAGWLESLAHLLRSAASPEAWLRLPAGDEGDTPLQRIRDRRCRSVLGDSHSLRLWLEQLDSRASRQRNQEEAVVKVTSWPTPSSTLIIMTTNKEKADTPLQQDLSIFPTLESGHREEYYLLRSSRDQFGSMPEQRKDTACAQTEVGKSIEDLLADQTKPQCAETGSVLLVSNGEYCVSQSMSQSVIFPSHEQQQQQEQQEQQHEDAESPMLGASSSLKASRSVSTPTLFADFMR